MRLLIRYRSGVDEVSERVISDITLEPPDYLHAYCHLRNEDRTFSLQRIEQAVNLDTGEFIPDIGTLFGLQPLKPPVPKMPVFTERPKPLSTEDSNRQRKSDKTRLFRKFKYVVIAEVFRKKLWRLFDNRCFFCGSTNNLELDHHIPQFLGGRLVAGNIVILCPRCNARKLDKHPKNFYTPEQLKRIDDILKSELELFDFTFNPTRFYNHPKDYLLSLGVTEQEAEAVAQKVLNPDGVGIGGHTSAK